jgi:hypothetical protein
MEKAKIARSATTKKAKPTKKTPTTTTTTTTKKTTKTKTTTTTKTKTKKGATWSRAQASRNHKLNPARDQKAIFRKINPKKNLPEKRQSKATAKTKTEISGRFRAGEVGGDYCFGAGKKINEADADNSRAQ